ncbi:MAG: S-methyl-5-thioribose-1-phosphate isomerase [Acidobacteria bacterium]|nr:MAG: S-methyl-5-thioribose-1-phosphate isomerase [Acidobacteriota bacterium]
MQAIQWKTNQLDLIDQRVLPFQEKTFTCKNIQDVFFAIKNMVVRGAPAIGVTAAYGLVLALQTNPTKEAFNASCRKLLSARPTAINLKDAVHTMTTALGDDLNPIRAEQIAVQYHRDDLAMNRQTGKNGASFLPGQRRILTHCNTGSLATSGWGTALGIIRELHRQDRLIEVIANETRPFLQGARLTVWECMQDNMPVRMATDGMGSYLMAEGKVDAVIVGSDRIAANGDVANKIGTSLLAIAARYYRIPFIVAAPSTTVDPQTRSGKDIPIEQRPAREVTHIRNQAIVPEGLEVYNPAFDITPAELVTAIITEEGVFEAPYCFNP